MTKKRLQKIYNCVKMHYNLFSASITDSKYVCRMLKNERKTLYHDFEKWYQSRRIGQSGDEVLTNQEIYDRYLEGTHCLYFGGDPKHLLSVLE